MRQNISHRHPELVSGSRIITTGESIVREHRQTTDDRSRLRRETMDEKAIKTQQPYRIIPQAQPSVIHRFFGRINWSMLIDMICTFLAILAIAVISGVMFFGPISWREFIR